MLNALTLNLTTNICQPSSHHHPSILINISTVVPNKPVLVLQTCPTSALALSTSSEGVEQCQ